MFLLIIYLLQEGIHRYLTFPFFCIVFYICIISYISEILYCHPFIYFRPFLLFPGNQIYTYYSTVGLLSMCPLILFPVYSRILEYSRRFLTTYITDTPTGYTGTSSTSLVVFLTLHSVNSSKISAI